MFKIKLTLFLICALLIKPSHAMEDSHKKATKKLFIAAANGDIEKVREALQEQADVNAAKKNGHTPLFYAILYNEPEVARILLENGALPNVRSRGTCWEVKGSTPLQHAVNRREPNRALVELLLAHGADVLAQDDAGDNALTYAIRSFTPLEIQRLLLVAGAEPNQQNRYGETPLLFSSREGQSETVRLLLEFGAHPDIPDKSGHFALSEAAYGKIIGRFLRNAWTLSSDEREAIAIALLEHGANTTMITSESELEANRCLRPHMLELLRVYGADIEESSRAQLTEIEQERIDTLLVTRHRPLLLTTFLRNAASRGNLEIFSLSFAQVSPKSELIVELFLKAASRGHVSILNFLSNNENIDIRSILTPEALYQALLRASVNGHSAAARFILEFNFEHVRMMDVNIVRRVNYLLHSSWPSEQLSNEYVIIHALLLNHQQRRLESVLEAFQPNNTVPRDTPSEAMLPIPDLEEQIQQMHIGLPFE